MLKGDVSAPCFEQFQLRRMLNVQKSMEGQSGITDVAGFFGFGPGSMESAGHNPSAGARNPGNSNRHGTAATARHEF
ncbi:hypothetical protein [Desulfacinum infernum]|uniref:hypothetical protein n=1 Tax=Desulfacinum infernum TaxID=35837 RepID=UPI001160623D|nr:hypothetical protein [Desulfacinum infernum]